LGTFAIYRRQISKPRPEELRLASIAGQLAGNAIERIRAERQLNDAQKRLSLAERVARFGIWEADFKTNMVTVSEGLAALMERPASKFQLTRGEFEAMVHPDDRGALWSDTDGRATMQNEFRLVLPSGVVRWMRSQWGFEDDVDPPTRATGAMIDVTIEKDMIVEAEQERAAAEASARVAREAEKLEQDRKTILELVANDQPLEHVAAVMAQTVATHSPGSLCGIRIQAPGEERIALYPGFPAMLADACDRIELDSINETLATAATTRLSNAPEWSRALTNAGGLVHKLYRAVPVVYESERIGVIFSLLREESADSQSQQKLLESWGRFASLAVERRGLYRQLSFRAEYDSLTSLLNRASLYDRAERLLRSSDNALALIYLDLDGFKEINDRRGHASGDVVLKTVASRLLASVRRTDTVARIGGDEFVIVLPGINDRGEAVRIANTVAEAVSAPVENFDETLLFSASVGVSLSPVDGNDIDALLKCADESMYKVKLARRRRLGLSQFSSDPDAAPQDQCA
jgi:diguanylate cyclase (GGDEF)-like protein